MKKTNGKKGNASPANNSKLPNINKNSKSPNGKSKSPKNTKTVTDKGKNNEIYPYMLQRKIPILFPLLVLMNHIPVVNRCSEEWKLGRKRHTLTANTHTHITKKDEPNNLW